MLRPLLWPYMSKSDVSEHRRRKRHSVQDILQKIVIACLVTCDLNYECHKLSTAS